MEALYKFVLFMIDNHHFALDINSIDRISKLVEITQLPNAPEIVIGIINVQGNVMPVVDIRKRLKLPQKEFELGDHLIIGHTTKRSLAILVDDIGELIEIQPKRLTKQGDILPGLGPIKGAIKLQGDVILIHDLESFLSIEEEKMIDAAMEESKSKPSPPPIKQETKLPKKVKAVKNVPKPKVEKKVKETKKTEEVKKEVQVEKAKTPTKKKKTTSKSKKTVQKETNKKTTKKATKTKVTKSKSKK